MFTESDRTLGCLDLPAKPVAQKWLNFEKWVIYCSLIPLSASKCGFSCNVEEICDWNHWRGEAEVVKQCQFQTCRGLSKKIFNNRTQKILQKSNPTVSSYVIRYDRIQSDRQSCKCFWALCLKDVLMHLPQEGNYFEFIYQWIQLEYWWENHMIISPLFIQITERSMTFKAYILVKQRGVHLFCFLINSSKHMCVCVCCSRWSVLILCVFYTPLTGRTSWRVEPELSNLSVLLFM